MADAPDWIARYAEQLAELIRNPPPKTGYPALVERYADGRQICNCGQAYYTNCGRGYVGNRILENLPACNGGCEANVIRARDEIADRVLIDLGLPERVRPPLKPYDPQP